MVKLMILDIFASFNNFLFLKQKKYNSLLIDNFAGCQISITFNKTLQFVNNFIFTRISQVVSNFWPAVYMHENL